MGFEQFDIAVAGARGLEQAFPRLQRLQMLRPGIADVPQVPEHREAACARLQPIDKCLGAKVQGLDFSRLRTFDRDQNRAMCQKNREPLAQRLRVLGQLIEQFQRLLEMGGRLTTCGLAGRFQACFLYSAVANIGDRRSTKE